MNDYVHLLEETETEDSDQGLADWANNLHSFRVRDKYVLKMLEDTVTSLGNQTSDMAIACISLFLHSCNWQKKSKVHSPSLCPINRMVNHRVQ